jgi:hypothetical protein
MFIYFGTKDFVVSDTKKSRPILLCQNFSNADLSFADWQTLIKRRKEKIRLHTGKRAGATCISHALPVTTWRRTYRDACFEDPGKHHSSLLNELNMENSAVPFLIPMAAALFRGQTTRTLASGDMYSSVSSDASGGLIVPTCRSGFRQR